MPSVRVKEVRPVPGMHRVYDLSVENTHTFFANGLAVHNCDTTGVEPDFALVKFKKLAGGGYFKIINQSIRPALKNLGYGEVEIDEIVYYVIGRGTLAGAPEIDEDTLRLHGLTDDDLGRIRQSLPTAFDLPSAINGWTLGPETMERLGIPAAKWQDPAFNLLRHFGFTKSQIRAASTYACGTQTVEGAPHLRPEHLPVFDCANRCGEQGQRFIHAHGHIRMMAAAQSFISGAISKTINMPHEATVDDVKEAYRLSWSLGLKANALYRDGCKLSQPLSTKSDREEDEDEADKAEAAKTDNELAVLGISTDDAPYAVTIDNDRIHAETVVEGEAAPRRHRPELKPAAAELTVNGVHRMDEEKTVKLVLEELEHLQALRTAAKAKPTPAAEMPAPAASKVSPAPAPQAAAPDPDSSTGADSLAGIPREALLAEVARIIREEDKDHTFLHALASEIEARKLPSRRSGFTQKAKINGHTIFLRTGEYENGQLGEIFVDMHKEGAAYRSLLNCFAIAVSIGLQHGVPLQEFVDKFLYTRFEPAGLVQLHPNIKTCSSVVDYIFRVLALEYLGRVDVAQVPPVVDSSPVAPPSPAQPELSLERGASAGSKSGDDLQRMVAEAVAAVLKRSPVAGQEMSRSMPSAEARSQAPELDANDADDLAHDSETIENDSPMVGAQACAVQPPPVAPPEFPIPQPSASSDAIPPVVNARAQTPASPASSAASPQTPLRRRIGFVTLDDAPTPTHTNVPLPEPPKPEAPKAKAKADPPAPRPSRRAPMPGDGRETLSLEPATRPDFDVPFDPVLDVSMVNYQRQLSSMMGDAPLCGECGSVMRRNGACFVCPTCGAGGGCG